MRKSSNYLIATVIVAAIIIYGSLYPFEFERRFDGLGPAARALIGGAAARPHPSDFTANVLLYLPFGYCAILAVGNGLALGRLVLVTLIGAILSTCMELAQYFDLDRVSAATDVYANALGTLLGACGGGIAGAGSRWQLLRKVAASRVPALILCAWAGYRLFPFVPTIDLHKYWVAVKPVLVHPVLTGYDFFRYTAIWLTVGTLIEGIAGSRQAWLLFPLFVGALLVGKVMIVSATLYPAELAGAASAFIVWSVLSFSPNGRRVLVALLFCGYVVAERLEPFQFLAVARPFQWIPFAGFLSDNIEVNVMSFLQKFFLYGGAVWLLCSLGLRLSGAALAVAAALFVTSQAERYLPDRSAEITDALLALTIGVIFALLGVKPAKPNNGLPANTTRGWLPPEDWPH